VFRRSPTARHRTNGAVPAPATHLVELREVVKDYVTDAGPFRALHGVTLEVDPGEFIAVVGKSGCGKSTLMNMLTGIDRPTEGEVWVAGSDIRHMGEGKMAEWRGRTVGVIFQFFQLLPTLTVVENVMLPMDFGGLWTPRERLERAMHLLGQVDMADQAGKLPSSTSGGQQQRVAIARALANDPPIIVADEPTGNLDSATAAAVFGLFHDLVDAGKTVIMVTHDHELAARTRRIVHMVDGRVLDGTVESNPGGAAERLGGAANAERPVGAAERPVGAAGAERAVTAAAGPGTPGVAAEPPVLGRS
jgi:putative ABC transport system ATP-binding protein